MVQLAKTRILVESKPTVIVRDASRTTVVDRRPAVEISGRTTVKITTGKQGPRGVPGAAGSGFDFTQVSPATVWTIAHNLGFRPDVATYRLGGTEMKGAVQHLSVNSLTVTFKTAVAGYARVS